MNDLFDISLAQWYAFETEAVNAASDLKNNNEDLEFYAQLVRCASEQAEVADPDDRLDAVRYMKTQVLHLEELIERKQVLEERANLTRARADQWKIGLREVANF